MGQYDFQAAYLLYGNRPLRQPENQHKAATARCQTACSIRFYGLEPCRRVFDAPSVVGVKQFSGCLSRRKPPFRQPEKPQIFYNGAIMPPTEQGIRYGSNQF